MTSPTPSYSEHALPDSTSKVILAFSQISATFPEFLPADAQHLAAARGLGFSNL